MCGIYGTTIRYNDDQVKAKLKRTIFRGPDQSDYSTYEKGNASITFGHNRLSIIDLDPRSNQPFNYKDKVKIVFNGEIYNFLELKEDLRKKGYEFRTTSDTEVICAAYLAYDRGCLEKFNGMFAFVIHDLDKNIFFGARDRLGQKPFYYYHDGLDFEFSSQISSIQLFNNKLSISKRAIQNYLSWDYVHEPLSIFNEIKKLKAGHFFTYDVSTGSIKLEQYWDIDFKGEKQFKGNYYEAQEKLETLLRGAVKRRLISDVPLGVFLSGGIDSSLIAALATQSSSEKVKTFSVKFNEKGFDESVYAQKVADHLGTDHHVIECQYEEGLNLIENFNYYYDEPFADPSAVPSMLLAKHTKQHVTVALSGDAGDENFIGYHRYNWAKYMSMIYGLPKPIRYTGAYLLRKFPYYKAKIVGGVINNSDLNNAYLSIMFGGKPSYLDDTYDRDIKPDELKYLFHDSKNIFERISDFDLKTYLNSDINTKVDRASMAYSLESRSPFMDYTVVEFGRSIPTDYKFKKGNQKRILKDILYKYLPEDIFNRPKAGFTMPFKEWFRNELKDFVYQKLNKDSISVIPGIDPVKVAEITDQHMNGSWNNYHALWKLIVLQQWLETNQKGFSIK
ncbi:asparagine synthase (glutamine-hydrolyzing) [Hyunsoonleella sp. SJ7]|uniref:asparagine synthase (glutamine-hydrolyzing) n=1 Tax=Hyunsoonleella aquatilis TaxID=2762758 RepID=A0A923HAT2_9FLAO|nr:asparagine synthase (glutamine-hydrolyzing) [Hyunsoonleella aquatilis]MBC3758989.1 asparagine synthase (glutamine-hydrolyzing) [Hyunsoonleella aquatilis]